MNNNSSIITIAHAVDSLNKEQLVAYPTEAVFAIGCDPDSEVAVNSLLKLKQRSVKKGLILIAANYMQLRPYIDDINLTTSQQEAIFSAWPGPVTFTFPVKVSTPYWLIGCFNSLAVRVTNHPLVIEFCNTFGKPLISTSANLSGQPPCRTTQEVHLQFGEHFLVVDGKVGDLNTPSEIRDVLTGKCFRQG